MAIRWTDFPHKEISADIHSRLNQNSVERSADDSMQHILRRRLHFLVSEEHRKFIELESRRIVERLRCTRDAYRAFTNSQGCSPAAEAYWVILRFAVLPTAVAGLRKSVFDYINHSRVPAADLSLLFGVSTRPCHHPNLRGDHGQLNPDDRTPANGEEIERLAGKVVEHTLLLVEDKGVWRPVGDGPFAIDDSHGIHHSWNLCALREGLTVPDWIPIRKNLWDLCRPWTEGLTALFGCVQDEVFSHWMALSPDGLAWEAKCKNERTNYRSVAVPKQAKDIREDAIQDDPSVSNEQDRNTTKGHTNPYRTPFQGLKPEMKTVDFSNFMLAAKLTDKQFDCFSLVKEYDRPMGEVELRMGITRKTIHEHVAAAERAIRKLNLNEYWAKAATRHKRPE
jgi:hypothetical protein